MPTLKDLKSRLAWFLVLTTFASPVVAQRKPVAAPKTPAPQVQESGPALDSLLAADSFKIYCEVRGVGGLIHSPAVNDLLEPLIKLGKPPKEIKLMVKWLNAHADALSGSRLLIAAWPSRPKLPDVLVAVEFSSTEEAKKFYPQLRDFLPTLLPTPTPTPSPSPSPSPSSSPSLSTEPASGRTDSAGNQYEIKLQPAIDSGEPPTPAPPPYQMSQAGPLVFISDKSFAMADLKPRGSKALEEDQNFILARSRFTAEPVFLFVDLKAIQKEEQERRDKWEEERKRAEEEAKNAPQPEESPEMTESSEGVTELASPEEIPETAVQEMPQPEPTIETVPIGPGPTGTLSVQPQPSVDLMSPFFFLLGGMGGGQVDWPEAIGAALVFEGDAFVARVLILNKPDSAGTAIPFMPQFVSGPALVPASPSVIPADADFFVTASVDYVGIYDRMLPIFSAAAAMSTNPNQRASDKPPETPFAEFENKLGMKLRGDLLPLLGNEMAVALLKKQNTEPKEPDRTSGPGAQPTPPPAPSGPTPVVAVSVKDREAVAKVIPKIIDAFGLKGANLFAQTEKRGTTEIVSYAGVFAYAFIDNFLVLSVDPNETRRVVDSYLNNQTLASDSHYRNFTRWQPRQVLGQVYVAPWLIEQFTLGNPPVGDKVHEFLGRMNPVVDPLTYSLTNDGVGHLHELHVPRNMLQLLIAGATGQSVDDPLRANEAMAQSTMRSVFSAETVFRTTDGNGNYGTLEELLSAGLVSKQQIERSGYRVELTVAGSKFAATAVPSNYGDTGRLSYFIDESGTLRAGDHGGGAATIADQPQP